LISISFCTFSPVTFTISLLTIPYTSVLISISFCTFSYAKVTDENVQKEIDINTEVLGIVIGVALVFCLVRQKMLAGCEGMLPLTFFFKKMGA
jgi:hypothetical protein